MAEFPAKNCASQPNRNTAGNAIKKSFRLPPISRTPMPAKIIRSAPVAAIAAMPSLEKIEDTDPESHENPGNAGLRPANASRTSAKPSQHATQSSDDSRLERRLEAAVMDGSSGALDSVPR